MMKRSLILSLISLTLTFCTGSQLHNKENRSYFHEMDLNFSKHKEKWYVSIMEIGGKNPMMLYNNTAKVKDITASYLLNYPNEHTTLECTVSVLNNKNEDKKSFNFYNTKDTIQIIDSSEYQMGGIYTIEDIPYPFSSKEVAKLITCEINGTIYTPVYYCKQEMNYPDDGITLVLEYYNLKNQ